MTRMLMVAVAAMSMACGGVQTQVTGTVGGKSLTAADAVTLIGVSGSGAQRSAAMVAIIGEQPKACEAWSGDTFKQNQALLTLTVGSIGENAEIPKPGKYDITLQQPMSGTTAAALWTVTDEKCKGKTQVPATGGFIKLETVSAESASGTFELTMLDGSSVKGGFSGKLCLFGFRVLNPDSDATCSP